MNRNKFGDVDVEEMASLGGIALINIAGNSGEARILGKKEPQTRVTHTDGAIL